jgi:asparagine synthase (glutamine-hydrolysing)
MCGIAGYIGSRIISEKTISSTLESLKSRGPDNKSYYCSKLNYKNKIYLLHTRLSIIDLDKRSNQPFSYKNFIIIFNGEIYNYLELRDHLKSKGYDFKTSGDTEVLIKLYDYYGVNFYDHLEGMWSLVIFDKKKKNIILSRDRFGEKPLYYVNDSRGFAFASSINALKIISNISPTINSEYINKILRLGYQAAFDDTGKFYFNEFKIVQPRTNYTVNQNLQVTKKIYWEPKFIPNNQISYEEAKLEIRKLLIDSVEKRCRSDVKFGILLSGGVDSSTIAAITSKILNYKTHCFSVIDKDIKYNELDNILLNKKSLNLKINLLKKNIFSFEELVKIINKNDTPMLTITEYVQYKLYELVKAKGFKVMLDGNGADEIFSGYISHYQSFFFNEKNILKNINYKIWKKKILKVIRNPILKRILKNEDDYLLSKVTSLNIVKHFINSKKNQEFKSRLNYTNLLRKEMLEQTIYNTLPVALNYSDKNAMNHSIENRSPFLDRKLFEFVYTLPNNYLINNGYLKYILRDAFSDLVPKKISFNYEKKGFNFELKTIFNYFKKENLKFLEVPNTNIKIQDILKKEYKDPDLNKFIFHLLNFHLLYKKFDEN